MEGEREDKGRGYEGGGEGGEGSGDGIRGYLRRGCRVWIRGDRELGGEGSLPFSKPYFRACRRHMSSLTPVT